MTDDPQPSPFVKFLGYLFVSAVVGVAALMAVALSRVAWTMPKDLNLKTQWQTSDEPSQKW